MRDMLELSRHALPQALMAALGATKGLAAVQGRSLAKRCNTYLPTSAVTAAAQQLRAA